MFTGFASENTPAIQVWDFSVGGSGTNRISLQDDCARIQLFKTGQSTTNIELFLPSCPIEGLTITIINHRYASSVQKITIRSSDTGTFGSLATIAELGPGATAVFYYFKNNISFGPVNGSRSTGWSRLDSGSESSANYGAVVLGGQYNTASGAYSATAGGQLNTVNNAVGASIIGGSSNTIPNNATNAAIVGGSSNTASSSGAAVIGGSSNTASQPNAFVGGGSGVTASGNGAVAIGGLTNTASGVRSSVIGGATSTASGNSSIVLGGNSNTANSFNSVVAGGSAGSARSIVGNFVYPSSDAPITFSAGVQQLATLLLGRQTTDATATVLTSNTSAAGTTNQVILPNNSAYAFEGTVIANVTGGGNTSSWKFEGAIKRGANAASTALVAAVTPTVIAQDVGAVTWTVAVTADTTNGGIAVTVTGAAATTIRWVCKIETTEVTY